MTIVLPIVFFAVCVGLFAKRITNAHWITLACWISLIIAYHFFKGA
ncbi:MAG: hypothetical protein ACRYFS_09415 [Janthinobacterium lividum]